MPTASARRAIGWFEDGKRADFPVREVVTRLGGGGARRREQRALLLRLLMEFARTNGTLHQSERAVLWEVCTALDLGRMELAQLEAILRAQRGFRGSDAGYVDAARVTAAYRTPGVDRTESNDDIKKLSVYVHKLGGGQ